MQNDKISLVVLRFEIDDSYYNINSTLNSNFIFKLFNYNPDSYKRKYPKQRFLLQQQDSIPLDLPENYTNKEEALKAFIGHREFHSLSVETYNFDDQNMSVTSEEYNLDQKIKKQNLVNNSLTMVKALETAYDDWNKNKPKSDEETSQQEDIVASEQPVKSSTIDEIETNEKKSEIISENTTTIKGSSSNLKLLSTVALPSTTKIPYYCGNPTVDIVKGVLHIYKDSDLTSLDDDSSRSEMLCMIGVPTNITCNELINFILPYSEGMLYMRIIRDTLPNQYMVLMKFKTQKDADDFYKYNNNRPFNLIEENSCHLVYVESVEAVNSSRGASLPIPGFTELPNCYICLEKMDESLSGVITILCNHSFHANCLNKWGDTNCPVCRYTQTPDFSNDSVCTECGSHENLWICLICGHVGCGRYVRGHAYSHFQLTQHTYSMQLGSNRVWDYAGDNYVHRLIQNKSDGKMVRYDEAGRVINSDEKVDSLTLEYSYLLTTQLESQRLFFEERMLKQEERSGAQLIDLERRAKLFEQENVMLKDTVENLSKDKANLEKKCSQLTVKVNKLQSSLDEEMQINKCMTTNQAAYQTRLNDIEEKLKKSETEKTAEIEDLKSQLRDVLFYLDAQSKLSNAEGVTKEELNDSHVVIQQQQQQQQPANDEDRKGFRKKKK